MSYMTRTKRVKPSYFWDGKTTVFTSRKLARAANKIVRVLEPLQQYERDELLRELKGLRNSQEVKEKNP